MWLLHQQEQPNNLTRRMNALSANLPALYSIPSSQLSRIDVWIFSLSHRVLSVGIHTKQAGAKSTVAWIKQKASGVIRVGGGRAELSLPRLVHLADSMVARRVNGEAVGWRESGFPRHHTGSARDGSLQDRGTGEY